MPCLTDPGHERSCGMHGSAGCAEPLSCSPVGMQQGQQLLHKPLSLPHLTGPVQW